MEKVERAVEKVERAVEEVERTYETFRVIDSKTGEEADTREIALHEEWAKSLIYCDIDGWAIHEDGNLLLLDDCGRFVYADRERFKVIWDEL